MEEQKRLLESIKNQSLQDKMLLLLEGIWELAKLLENVSIDYNKIENCTN